MRMLEFPFAAPAPDGELQEVAPGILWLRMPMPFRLDHINLYLLRDSGGWLIVDTGLNTDETHVIWERIFAQLPAGEPITGVLCTHSHTDHAGALGWLVDKLRVPVYMSFGDYYSLRVSAMEKTYDAWQHLDYYSQVGLPAGHMEKLHKSMGSMQWYAPVPAAYRRLRHDDNIVFGDNTWRVIVGEGHAPEHVSLYCEPLKVLICGDQLLPRISANVGVTVTEPDANPLRLWLDSLERIGRLPADTLVLPSHDLPYRGLVQRAEELQQHHEKQLQNLLALCARQPGNAFELMQSMFPRRHGPLDDFLAVAECMAHLAYLLDEKKITRTLREDGTYQFKTASPAK